METISLRTINPININIENLLTLSIMSLVNVGNNDLPYS
jgi:hypothetical protein